MAVVVMVLSLRVAGEFHNGWTAIDNTSTVIANTVTKRRTPTPLGSAS